MFKTCDNCKSEIKYYERKCPHCGRAFTTLTRSDFPDDESYENHVKTGRLFFVFMFTGIFISIILIAIYLLEMYDKIEYNWFTGYVAPRYGQPPFIAAIIYAIYVINSKNKRTTSMTEGKIVEYKTRNKTYPSYRERPNYYISTPIAEYVVDGKTYRCSSHITVITYFAPCMKKLKNENVKIKYNKDDPTESKIVYSLGQLIELNRKLIFCIIATIILGIWFAIKMN